MPKTMTIQETFNKAYLFILKQGRQSIEDGGTGMCQYRGQNNAMCAAGCLIDDAHYREYFEGHALDQDGDPQAYAGICKALALSGVPEQAFPMVRDLQIVHDGLAELGTGKMYTPTKRYEIENDFVTHWKAGCAFIAAKYGLIIPEVPA